MTNEGFSALLMLLFAGAAGVLLPRRVDADAWQHRSRRARLWRYQLSCWASLLVAVGGVLWLWGFEPAAVDDDVLLLAPGPWAWDFLLPFLFLWAGASMALLVPLQLVCCGRLVFARPTAEPAKEGKGSVWSFVVFAVVIWLPALLGYEAMRGDSVEVGVDVLRRDPFWSGQVDQRSWADVVRLDYRPWRGGERRGRLRHGMAFVFADGSEWDLREDLYWGLDDRAVRDRLRTMVRARGIEYRHG